MVSGIGQAGKLPHYTRGNVLNVLHGRTLPAAAGAKIANPEMTVIAVGGDGDGYGEGGNHFLHSVRRNHDITYLVHDNQVYALTKGQASPTSDKGFVTKTTPLGASTPLNALAVAIAAGGTFVARGFSGDIDHLVGLIKSGVQHRGFALIDILQPCVSFNHKNTHAWYKGEGLHAGGGHLQGQRQVSRDGEGTGVGREDTHWHHLPAGEALFRGRACSSQERASGETAHRSSSSGHTVG